MATAEGADSVGSAAEGAGADPHHPGQGAPAPHHDAR